MLVILEMANNHMGDVELGKQIIREHHEVTRRYPAHQYAFKFQYRYLPKYIYPGADPEHKYVKRFRDTNLSENDRLILRDYAKGRGFLAACTPFDEKSVDDVVKHGYDILKVGSPSFTDWQLWDCVLNAWDGPIIASCGGATMEEIDRVVYMCDDVDLTLMHCASEYPTTLPNEQLNQIVWLKRRYNIPVGLSSHSESFVDTKLAAVMGANAIEKHVCLEPVPNNYSVTPLGMEEILFHLDMASKHLGESYRVRVPGIEPKQFKRQDIGGKMWWKP